MHYDTITSIYRDAWGIIDRYSMRLPSYSLMVKIELHDAKDKRQKAVPVTTIVYEQDGIDANTIAHVEHQFINPLLLQFEFHIQQAAIKHHSLTVGKVK